MEAVGPVGEGQEFTLDGVLGEEDAQEMDLEVDGAAEGSHAEDGDPEADLEERVGEMVTKVCVCVCVCLIVSFPTPSTLLPPSLTNV